MNGTERPNVFAHVPQSGDPAPQASNDATVMEFDRAEVDQTFVACPMIRGELRPVSACFTCQHFATVRDKLPGDAKGREFHARYIVGCKYPTARPLFKVHRTGVSPA